MIIVDDFVVVGVCLFECCYYVVVGGFVDEWVY